MNNKGSGTVVGAVIILTIIFTTVASYFLSIERENQRINDSQIIKLTRLEEKSREDLDIRFDTNLVNITNKSPLTITLLYYFVLKDDDLIRSNILNLTLKNGESALIDIGVENNNIIKFVSERGSLFLAKCCDKVNNENNNNENNNNENNDVLELMHAEFQRGRRITEWSNKNTVQTLQQVAFKVEFINNSDENIWLSSRSSLFIFSTLQQANWHLVKNAENSIDYLYDEVNPYIKIPANSNTILYFAAKNYDRRDADPPIFVFVRGSVCGTTLLLVGYYGDNAPDLNRPYSKIIDHKVIIAG
ncbi:MAG: hypothetical protein QW416_01325 [Candidatus Nitrosocaldaceae archaeon]